MAAAADQSPTKLSSVYAYKREDDRLVLGGTDALGRFWQSRQATPGGSVWLPMVEFSAVSSDPGHLSSIAAETNSNGVVEIHAVDAADKVAYTSVVAGLPSSWVKTPELLPVNRAVPDLRGKTQPVAKQLLASSFLLFGLAGSTPVREFIDSGKVQTQSRAAGSVVPTGTTISVTIGVWDGSHK